MFTSLLCGKWSMVPADSSLFISNLNISTSSPRCTGVHQVYLLEFLKVKLPSNSFERIELGCFKQ
jgi:hypothetical protein